MNVIARCRLIFNGNDVHLVLRATSTKSDIPVIDFRIEISEYEEQNKINRWDSVRGFLYEL